MSHRWRQVIVFSQFWTHMMLIGRHLRAAGVRCAELRSHMRAEEKSRALHRFRNDPAVSILMMDEIGSVGLVRRRATASS